MVNTIRKQVLLKALAFFACIAAFNISAKAGADSYEVYLNEKLLFRQYMTQTLSMQQLPISAINKNDRITIKYSHCGQIGINRSISIRDAKGNILKTWKFADAKGTDKGMVIPVKELLELDKNSKGNQLNLYYSAQQLPKGQQLTYFRVGDKSTTRTNANRETIPLIAGLLAMVCGTMLGYEKS